MCVCVCFVLCVGRKAGRGSVKTVSRGLEYQLLVSART